MFYNAYYSDSNFLSFLKDAKHYKLNCGALSIPDLLRLCLPRCHGSPEFAFIIPVMFYTITACV